MTRVLRPYQQDMIAEARGLLRVHQDILMVAPTGSGKTSLASYMLHSAASRGKRGWFTVPKIELVHQAIETFEEMSIPYGVIAAGFPLNPNMPIQICSIDTLRNRLGRYQPPDLVVIDEAHHVAAGGWAKVKAFNAQAKHVGLSATPERLDGKGLDDFFSAMVQGPSVAWLIEQGYLAKYRAFAPPGPSMQGVATSMGDYARGESAAIMDKPTITGDAIKHYLRLARGKRAVAFCVSVAHSEHVAEQFRAAGIVAVHLDGTTDKTDRRKAIAAFRRGEIQVLTNCGLFAEGVDIPALDAVILLRPTKSLAMYMQMVGRVLRPAPGKVALILDHANCIATHGLPDDDRTWSLEGRKKAKREAGDAGPPVRQCPKCLDPKTPILYADMTWRPIGEAKVGDKLIAFDEHLPGGRGNGRKFRVAEVQNIMWSRRATLRVRTEHADIITTSDHKWLGSPKMRTNRNREWFETADLGTGDELQFVSAPRHHAETKPYMAGYIAGTTAGDGTFRHCSDIKRDHRRGLQAYWRVAMKDAEPLHRLVRFLGVFGVTAHVRPYRNGDKPNRAPMQKVEVRARPLLADIFDAINQPHCEEFSRGYIAGFFDAEGSHSGAVRLTQVNPFPLLTVCEMAKKLGHKMTLEKRCKEWANKSRLHGGVREKIAFFSDALPAIQRKLSMDGYAFHAETSRVISVEPHEEMDVVDITTSTGTFIAAGLATHNCYAAHAPRPKCPECGHIYVVEAREPELVDADLVEVDLDAARMRRVIENKRADNITALISMGKERKYQRPEIWAAHYRKARIGSDATLGELIAHAAAEGKADPTKWAAGVMSAVLRR